MSHSKFDIERVNAAVHELKSALNDTEFFYYVRERVAAYEGLLKRFAPLQVGDRAKLTKTPEITLERAWGWMGAKHFLIEGHEGEVVSVEFSNGLFRYAFKPDNQSWANTFNGVVTPLVEQDYAHYQFSEKWLEKV